LIYTELQYTFCPKKYTAKDKSATPLFSCLSARQPAIKVKSKKDILEKIIFFCRKMNFWAAKAFYSYPNNKC
jgi:hypothetical protein